MRVFAPRFTQAMAQRSEQYLPGDAQNLSKEMALEMGAWIVDAAPAAATTGPGTGPGTGAGATNGEEEGDRGDEGEEDLLSFLHLYRRRYMGKLVTGNLEILEDCLLHVLKMPFELASSVEQGLIRY